MTAAAGAPRRHAFALGHALAEVDQIAALLDALLAPGGAARPVAGTAPVEPAWSAVLEQVASDEERVLLIGLAHLPGVPIPLLGVEAQGGIPVDVSWPDLRVAAAVSTLTPGDAADLEAAGWRVAPPDAAALAELLRDARR